MEIVKKFGLVLVKNDDKVYLQNVLKFPGADADDFLPGMGGLYTLELEDECFDGRGLNSVSVNETNNGFEALFENDDILLKITFDYDEKSGVWSRKDSITNKQNVEKTIRKYQSRFAISDADCPMEVYTQNSGWCSENQGSWQDIGRGIRTETRGLRVMDGATPYMAIRKKESKYGIAFHIAPIGKWSINVTKRISYKIRASYMIDMGLCETGLNLKIAPKETLNMPEIMFHSFSDVGLGAHKIHRFVLSNRFNANEPKVIYNSWLYNFDNFTLDDLKRQLKTASQIGCDCFLVDAGWYGDENWETSTGDWQESKIKFPNGLLEFGEECKKYGVGLGLWMECERASKQSEIYKKHPEYFFETEDDENSVIVDFSIPDAREHVKSEIKRLIDTYDLKMMKFDFNVGCTHDKTGSNFYRYYQNFYEMMDELKKEYPDFFFEGCAGGGCCADLSSTSHYDCHHMTDTVHPLMDLRIYQGAMLRLPPYSLSKWVCIQNADLKSENVTYKTKGRILSNASQFLWERSADCGFDFAVEQAALGLLGFSSDIAALDDETKANLKKYVADFKNNIKKRKDYTCSLLMPPAPLSDTRMPAAFQLSDENFDEIIIKVFRTEGVERTFILEPVGIDENAVYEINDGKMSTVTGKEIVDFGLEVYVDYFYEVKTVTLLKVEP